MECCHLNGPECIYLWWHLLATKKHDIAKILVVVFVTLIYVLSIPCIIIIMLGSMFRERSCWCRYNIHGVTWPKWKHTSYVYSWFMLLLKPTDLKCFGWIEILLSIQLELACSLFFIMTIYMYLLCLVVWLSDFCEQQGWFGQCYLALTSGLPSHFEALKYAKPGDSIWTVVFVITGLCVSDLSTIEMGGLCRLFSPWYMNDKEFRSLKYILCVPHSFVLNLLYINNQDQHVTEWFRMVLTPRWGCSRHVYTSSFGRILDNWNL